MAESQINREDLQVVVNCRLNTPSVLINSTKKRRSSNSPLMQFLS